MNEEQMIQLTTIAKQEAQKVLHKIPLLGAVSWLMMHQSTTKFAFIGDMEWRVMPPLILEQAKLYMKDESPIAFVTWAKLSIEAIERYKKPPYRLAPADWNSGEQIWVIDIFIPFGGAKEVINDLKTNVFKGEPFYQLAPLPNNGTSTLVW